MKRRAFLQWGAVSAAWAAAAPMAPASAQGAYPDRPVRLVVPFAPGGPTDSFARLYAAGLAQVLGQAVVVENKSGAGGALGVMDVRRSAADGYTLLFGTASTHALYNLVQPAPQYDALADFSYIAVLGGSPVVFVSRPDRPDTLGAWVQASRQQAGQFNYGSPGTGTLLHVVAERFRQMSGADMVHVPFRGSAPAMQALLGGNVDLTVDTLGSALPQHRSGRARILAVATRDRVPLTPELPTVDESLSLGQPFESLLWHVVTVPRGVPAPVLDRLAQASKQVMSDAALAERLASQAMFVDAHIGHDAALAFVKAEQDRLKPVVAALGPLTNQ